MKNVKKLLSLLLIATMLFCLAACNAAPAAPAEKEPEAPAQASSANAAEAPAEQVTITFWHSLGAEASGEVINEFIPLYESEHPNIKIDVQSFQSDDYQQRQLKVAVSNGSQADVFHTYGAGYSQPFVDAGACLPLDSYFDADNTWDRLCGGVLDYMTYDGVSYGIPLTRWVGVLFCNTELFEKYSVEYPETWDQLVAACKTFRDNGLTPLCCGAKEGWHACLYQNVFAVRSAGAEYCNAALIGEATLDTPEIVRSAQMMLDLREVGAFDDGVLGMGSDEANMEFMMGNIPMYFSGSWSCSEIVSEENAVNGKVKVMALPSLDGGKGNGQFLGGATACYMINSHTEHPAEAVAFATALAEYQANECYIRGDDITCWKADIDTSNINPYLRDVCDISAASTGYVLAWDTFLVGSAIDTHYTLVQELLGGAITAEEFAAQSQAANEEALG